ncbi:heparinase II/III family protein [Nonomuraea sp. NBC_01738]|uniref:heparinase II/III family protein n=1 Tax=Nonomuraea sp. NBC_01738 TaxID=2976003 RepID=UPI002E0ED92A|nr:heparinase II/III family protein [Nonomuraea sp. NBC_01738]
MRRVAIPLALMLAASGLGAPAHADEKVKRTEQCQGDWIPGTPTADDVMRGEISLVGQPPYKLGKKINWGASPYKNRSWEFVFQSLRWVGTLVVAYENGGGERYLERAKEITKDWVVNNKRGARATKPYVWKDHPVSLRSQALICLSMHVNDGWLKDSLKEHATLLSNPALYKKGHNHGIDQDIALMGIGCRTGRKDWTSLAIKRLGGTVKLDVDSQGALMEQAPRYAVYVYGRLQVAMANMRECGRKVPSDLTKRADALKDFIAHSTEPSGYMAPIGDGSAETEPKMEVGQPKEKVKVYKAGYVYGRSDWTKEAAYYSLRFGPGMKFHGHEDHLGVTYFAQGRDVLVDAGFHSYEKTSYRYWTLSPEAHNIPVVQGARFRPRTASKLTKSKIGKDRQSFTVTDKAYGVSRTRSVLVDHDGEGLMAVLDKAGSGKKLKNIWRFDPSLKEISTGGGRVVLGDGKFKVTLLQFAGCKPVSGQKVERGGKLGWVSPTYLSKVPASVVSSPARGELLTVIVPGTDSPSVSCKGGKVTVNGVTFPADLF